MRQPVRCSAMALDPRTPVVVGVGQVSTPADAGLAAGGPARAARAHDGGAAGGRGGLRRRRAGRLGPGRVARCCAGPTASASWRRSAGMPSTRPWRWRRASGSPRVRSRAQLMVSAIGGNSPQALMHDACRAISRGDLDVVLVTGAEAMYARALHAARPGQAVARVGHPAGRDPGARGVRRRQAGRDRARDEPRRDPAGARVPAVRERAARRQRLDARGARRPRSARCGRASARWRPPTPTPGSARRARPAEIVTPSAGQPDGLVPLPQAVHGQHAGRPGRRLHRVLGRGGARGGGARGALGLPAGRRRRQRPLVHLAAGRAAPLPRHPPGRRGRRWRWPASGSTTWRRSTSTPASRPSCRWRRPSSGWRSTTRPGR